MDRSLGNTVLDHIHFLPTSYSSHTKPVNYEYGAIVINFGSILETIKVSFKNTDAKLHCRESNLIVLDRGRISMFFLKKALYLILR